MNPQLMMAGMQAAGMAARTAPAGPSSAFGKSESAQRGVMDGSGWSINYGGAQIAGGVSWWLLAAGAALGLVWLLKKR